MERKVIFAQLNEIFCDVLDIEEVSLTDETTAEDIDEWDSLGHIQLIGAIENKFKVKFSAQELMAWKNVGDMVDCMQNKI